jgi:peptidoglycan L-alanyl-D-glutamate endopeptidase CwlK
MKQAAKELNVAIIWGGDWRRFKDGPHFELDRKKYP